MLRQFTSKLALEADRKTIDSLTKERISGIVRGTPQKQPCGGEHRDRSALEAAPPTFRGRASHWASAPREAPSVPYDPRRDYYQLLQVDSRAHPKVIESAYRALVSLQHPDLHGGSTDSTERTKLLNEAASVLRDAQQRRQYDQERERHLSLTGQSGRANPAATAGHVSSRSARDCQIELDARLVELEFISLGRFLKSSTGELFFFDQLQHRLLELRSEEFITRVRLKLRPSATEGEFNYVTRHLLASCARKGTMVETRRLSHFFTSSKTLYVSRFDGFMYRLDGRSIKRIANGTEGVFFVDDPLWKPYAYLGSRRLPDYDGMLHRTVLRPLRFETSTNRSRDHHAVQEHYRTILSAWLLGCFFSSLMPTRPILVLTGPDGSGKSTVLRLILKLLFGSAADVDGVSEERPGEFRTLLLREKVVAIDNLDRVPGWLADDLASVCAGLRIKTRKPHAPAEVSYIRPDVSVAVASRTAALPRDDILDVAVLLPLQRGGRNKGELELLQRVQRRRNRLWSDLLRVLNLIVRAIRTGRPAPGKPARMADWYAFVWTFSQAMGFEKAFESLMTHQDEQRAVRLIAGDPLLPTLLRWLRSPKNVGLEVTSKDLARRLAAVAAKAGMTWTYGSPRSLAQRIKRLESVIRRHLAMTVRVGRAGYLVYSFKPLSVAGGQSM